MAGRQAGIPDVAASPLALPAFATERSEFEDTLVEAGCARLGRLPKSDS